MRAPVKLSEREDQRLTQLLEQKLAEGYTPEELHDLSTVVSLGAYETRFYQISMYDTNGSFLNLDESGEPIVFEWIYIEADMRLVGRKYVLVLRDKAIIPGREIEQAICASGNSRPMDGHSSIIVAYRDVETDTVMIKELRKVDIWTPFE